MEKILLVPILFSFFITLFFIPAWIKRAKDAGLSGKDMHKKSEEKIAESGGICVLFGFSFGILVYVAITTFYFNSTDYLIEIFSLLASILIIGFVGFLDDILGWKIGLNKKVRILFLIFAAIPLMVINAGESTMIGINFGLLYPLFLIPLGIVGASATFNFIAGYNGLEASQGIIILSALAFVTWLLGKGWLSLILSVMICCLIALFIFNKYPARVFPGDVLTYSVGALIAITAILGNIEMIAVLFFIPYIIETILKLRGGLKMESFAKLDKNGGMEKPYSKFYGLEHIAISFLKKIKKEKVHEKEVVYTINLFQILVIVLTLVIFRGSLF